MSLKHIILINIFKGFSTGRIDLMLRIDRKPEKEGDRWVHSIEASLLGTKTDRTNGKYPAHLFYNLGFITFGSPSSKERNATT